MVYEVTLDAIKSDEGLDLKRRIGFFIFLYAFIKNAVMVSWGFMGVIVNYIGGTPNIAILLLQVS